MLCALSKEEKQKRSKRLRFCEHNVSNKIITRGEFYLLKLESLRYTA